MSFSVARVIVAVAPCDAQRTALLVHGGEGVSAEGVNPAIQGFWGSPPMEMLTFWTSNGTFSSKF